MKCEVNRDFLSGQGIKDETVINAIMEAVGELQEAYKGANANLKTANADLEESKKTISEHETTIADLNNQIKGFDGKEQTLQELQKKVEDYEKAESDRRKAESEAEADRILTENIMNGIGEKQFINDFTKDAVISQVKAELAKAENKGKSAKDILDAVTKDKEGIWQNPQHEQLQLPGAGDNHAAGINGDPNKMDFATYKKWREQNK